MAQIKRALEDLQENQYVITTVSPALEQLRHEFGVCPKCQSRIELLWDEEDELIVECDNCGYSMQEENKGLLTRGI